MIDERQAYPVDYLAHNVGYINRHGEALETFTDDYDDDRYTDYDDDAYPCSEAC